MRIRFKPWARPELEASKFYIDNPEEYKGKWKEAFKEPSNELHLELGCGKGSFISQLAVKNHNINYLAIDLVDAMLGLAKRNIEQKYNENKKEIDNIIITRYDIERILNILNLEDNVKRIYINFCNPWPRGKHHKKRLTHIRQLDKYKQFLQKNGEIFFKTDDDSLFADSLLYFKQTGFTIEKFTYDLEKEENFWDNIVTEHEQMFMNEGIKIKAVIARLEE
ncbi:MAG: tRNA (guanosine(46)-N7)-methyltransferase TrmB [Clostridia bacterium]|jgi:tRNA (guanine-N7-)-methyltransferase|nr:tRNA (guanosine(46)-N7)-methyltransferase TrmB [Clostridia bacterium]